MRGSLVFVLGVFVFDTTFCITCNQPHILDSLLIALANQRHCDSLAQGCSYACLRYYLPCWLDL